MWAWRFCLGWLLACSGVGLGAEEALTVYTNEQPPLSWIEAGNPKGFTYELVTATMKELGLPPEIQFTGYARAMKLLQTQKKIVFFAAPRIAGQAPSLKWAGPLLQEDIYIYKRKHSPLEANTLDDLRKLKSIGVTQGMGPDLFLTGQGLTNVMRSSNQANTLRALSHRRVEAIVMGKISIYPTARMIGLDPDQIEASPLRLYESPLYIAFSPDISDDTVRLWQKKLDKIKHEKGAELSKLYLH